MKISPAILSLYFSSALFAAVEEPKLLFQNPGMETGLLVPVGWHGKFGNCTVTRDTTVFHGGSASLCVDRSAIANKKNASAHQLLEVKPGTKLKLTGWTRSEGEVKVHFAAHFFDATYAWNEFVSINLLEGTHDWQKGESEIVVPELATRLAISLYVEGQGKGWLDEVSLKAEGAKVVVEKLKPLPKAPEAAKDPKLIPTTAVPGHLPAYPGVWLLYHQQHVRRAKEGGIDVLFLGDSLTQGWLAEGRPSWEKSFAPLKSACFGIGDDQTGHLLWRLDKGEVAGISPKVVVLMIGTNNLWSGLNSSAEIVTGIRSVVEKLRKKLPDTKIVVLGLLPVGPNLSDLGRQRVTEINQLASPLDDGAMVRFFNPGARLLRRDGALLDGAFQADNVHLTSQGYAVLAKELAPLVVELINPAPAATLPAQ